MLRSLRFFHLFLIVTTSARIFMKRTPVENNIKSRHGPRLECMSGRRSPGEYFYISRGIEKDPVCGLYLMGMSNQLVELEFTTFDVDCEQDELGNPKSVVMVIDGWELNGEFFPGRREHPINDRMSWFCGDKTPKTVLTTSQNSGLIQFIIPKAGQGFSVKIRMPQNIQPCNVISTYIEGLYTIRNYGERINCSMSILYPEKIRFLSVDVGITPTNPLIPPTQKCNRAEDYVELLDGNGLEPDRDYMYSIESACGQSSSPESRAVLLGCNNSVVRLVSSGKFHNSVTFSYFEPSRSELAAFNEPCDMALPYYEEDYIDEE